MSDIVTLDLARLIYEKVSALQTEVAELKMRAQTAQSALALVSFSLDRVMADVEEIKRRLIPESGD